jgi:KDO2-lipid IV(A) lauroyltransferase
LSDPSARGRLASVRLATRLRFRLEDCATAVLEQACRLVPRRATPALGAVVGTGAWLLAGRRRQIALDNARRALGGELGPGPCGPLVRRAYRQFGRILLEGLMFPRYSARDAGTLLRYTGLEHIRSAYESGRGVLLFSGHYGNWELVALMQGYLGMPLTMITRPLDNPLLERRLARLRGLSGNEIQHKKHALRPMLAALSAGRGVAIVIDQNVRDGSAVFVDFFGRKAATTPALALLALRTGAAVMPVFAIPEGSGRYRVEYLPEVVPVRTGDRQADVLDLTQRCTQVIERYVRAHQGAWLWMHERWKTRPPDEGGKKAPEAKEALA